MPEPISIACLIVSILSNAITLRTVTWCCRKYLSRLTLNRQVFVERNEILAAKLLQRNPL